MRFNGVDPVTMHHALRMDHEIVPGYPACEIITISTSSGELLAAVNIRQDEYVARINIAAKTREEAAAARLALAAWAGSAHGQTAELEPTDFPGKAYTAVLKGVSRFEKKFAAVDVTFTLPRPILHDVIAKTASAHGNALLLTIGGSAPTQLEMTFVPDETVQGLTLSVGGAAVLAMSGEIAAGQTVEYNMRTCALTVDGQRAENRMLYTDMDPDWELMPGAHQITASASGQMTARWRNEWL